MSEARDRNVSAKARAVLIDPQSMTVVWANEAASEGELGESRSEIAGASIGRLVPMAEALGVPEALHSVAETGVARHLHADLVSMARGSVAMVISVYRLPDGLLLVLIENAWQVGERKARPRHGSR